MSAHAPRMVQGMLALLRNCPEVSGECVCACVYGCVGMYVHMCVCGHALAKRQYPYIRTYESQFTGVLERSSVCIES